VSPGLASPFDVEQLCEVFTIPKSGKVTGFPLNASHLKLRRKSLKVHVCEQRSPATAGILAIEGMLGVVGGITGLKGHNLHILDEEFVRLLGDDIVDRPMRPLGNLALRVLRENPTGVANIHHDRNGAGAIYATFLTYLNDEDDGLGGGHTIFPTLARNGHQLKQDQQELAHYLHKTYDQAIHDHDKSHVLLERHPEWAVNVVNDMCQGVLNNTQTHLFALKPRIDLTLLLFSFLEGQQGYLAEVGEHWHAGCGHDSDKMMLLRFAYLREELMPGSGNYNDLIGVGHK